MYAQEDFCISPKSVLLSFMRKRLALTILMLLVSDLSSTKFLVLKFIHLLLNSVHLVFLQRSGDTTTDPLRKYFPLGQLEMSPR